jgi:NAD(P)-dependent dehydrogenase (short-subunit alcohol dehydrogenase family)
VGGKHRNPTYPDLRKQWETDMTSNALAGLVALVTGASGNIGAAICEALLREGAEIVATDISAESAHGVEVLDVTSETSWSHAVDRTIARQGRLDILVNCAGIAPIARIADTSLADWRRCQAINVEGPLLGMKAALPHLIVSGSRRTGGASIVNVASAAANRAAAMTSAYCSSKAALVMLSKVAAVEFATLGHPVRVNTVNPGAVESEMIDGIVRHYSSIDDTPIADLEAAMRRNVPMGRLARPDDVADAVVWLASCGSRFVTGTELHVDGGMTAA